MSAVELEELVYLRGGCCKKIDFTISNVSGNGIYYCKLRILICWICWTIDRSSMDMDILIERFMQ